MMRHQPDQGARKEGRAIEWIEDTFQRQLGKYTPLTIQSVQGIRPCFILPCDGPENA